MKRRSIATQLMRKVFILYCVVALVVTSIHIYEELKYTQRAIENELRSYEMIFGQVLGKSLWDLELEQIESVLDAMIEVPIIEGVRLVDLHGNPVSKIGNMQTLNAKETFSNGIYYTFPIAYEYLGERRELGFATLFSNNQVIFKRVEIGFLFLIVNAVLKGIALWCIFLFFSHRILTKPLEALTDSVDDIEFDKLKAIPAPLSVEKHNEIDVLKASFSSMIDKLIDARDKLLHFNRELEYKVQERTQSLLQSKNDAERALKFKSDFLACMSHEIRTPMNGVLGMMGLLEKSSLDERQQHQLSVAMSSAKSLLAIINDILDLSKLESGKMELEAMDFDLHTFHQEVFACLALKANKKSLELVVNTINVKHANVKGDQVRLRQILNNIIDNAVKFTEAGEVVVTVSTESFGEEIRYCCQVRDTGIGIPKESIDELFQSYTQVDASTTRKFGGTGLGLAITYKLANEMGGDISVLSEEGVGSSFDINVKMMSPQSDENMAFEVDLSDRCIVIIDDNESSRSIMAEHISSLGAIVHEAFCIEEADSIIKTLQNQVRSICNMVLIKRHLGHDDGLEYGIQLHKQWPDIKLILMTSMLDDGSELFYKAAGFSATFTKPIIAQELSIVLHLVTYGCDEIKHLDENPPPYSSSYNANIPNNEKYKILLVEDNLINQQVVLGLLESLQNTEVVTAENGREALDCLEKSAPNDPFHLILMDCMMPEMDGYEATQLIRNGGVSGELNHYTNIHIIALTANSLEGDRERCLEVGMSDYMSKPLDAEILEEKILSALKK